MTLKKFASVVIAIAIVGVPGIHAAVQASSIIEAIYNPANGNIRLQNTTSGTVYIQSFDIITLGNGSVGPVSGNPGNVGFLSGSAAILPPFAFPVSNTSQFGINGLYSQVGGANVGSAAFSLSPYLSPVGSYWDLGNIAVPGMTLAQVNARFLTDPELTPPNFDSPLYGKFLVSYSLTPGGPFSITTPMSFPVPEPSTYAIALAGIACGGFSTWRRRKRA